MIAEGAAAVSADCVGDPSFIAQAVGWMHDEVKFVGTCLRMCTRVVVIGIIAENLGFA